MSYTSKSIVLLQKTRPDDSQSVGWSIELCKRFRDELGGVHLGTLEAHAKIGHLLLASSEGQNLGCMVTKPGNSTDARIFPIIAAAVPTDVQRLHVGLSMLHALDERHQLARDRIFQACCRCDLPSNRFWAAAGFEPIAVRHTSSVRGKPIIVWRRRVDRAVIGVQRIIDDARPRMGGGRFLPADRPDLATIVDQSFGGITEALKRSGARPITPRWAKFQWDGPHTYEVPKIIRPERPNDPQLALFEQRPTSAVFRG